MDTDTLVRHFGMLPSRDLRRAAKWFDGVAGQLHGLADHAEAGETRAQKNRDRRQSLDTAADIIAHYLMAGQTADEAIRATAAVTGLDTAALTEIAPKIRRQLDVKRRSERDRRIAQMAARGYTDREIGERHQLHPKHVNRILRRQRAAGTPDAPPITRTAETHRDDATSCASCSFASATPTPSRPSQSFR